MAIILQYIFGSELISDTTFARQPTKTCAKLLNGVSFKNVNVYYMKENGKKSRN